MIVFFGTRTYGKVDQVPGLFYVATKFFYIQFVPLVPTESYLIFEGTEEGDSFRGCQIPMNGKSVLFAWMRFILFIAAVVTGLIAVVELVSVAQGRTGWQRLVTMGLAAVLSAVGFWVSYRLAHASPTRALKIASHAGIPPEALAQYFVNSRSLPSSDVQDVVPADPDR